MVMSFKRTGFKICGETHERKVEGKGENLSLIKLDWKSFKTRFGNNTNELKQEKKNEQTVLTGLADCST